MGAKKRTKPIVPAKKETARRLWTIRWLQHSNIWKAKKGNQPFRFATLWEAATEFIETDEFKKVVRIYHKNKSEVYIEDLLNNRDVYGNKFKINKTQRKIKFVLNMFREIKEDLPKKMLPFELPKPTAKDKLYIELLYKGLGSFIKKKN